MFEQIEQHRHPEKNAAIMQISFKLGLRVQEIALLEVKEVAKLNSTGTDFELYEIMTLPAAYTKGAGATRKDVPAKSRRTSVTFKVAEFDRVARQIWKMGQAGQELDPVDFYPEASKRKGKSRDLPLVNPELRYAISRYLRYRIAKEGSVTASSRLFISQKGGPYTPDTLQRHMATIMRTWCGYEKARSHSGRRTLITDLLQNQKVPAKVAQKIAGHVDGGTTLIYAEPSEFEIRDALLNVGRRRAW
jgi:integrase